VSQQRCISPKHFWQLTDNCGSCYSAQRTHLHEHRTAQTPQPELVCTLHHLLLLLQGLLQSRQQKLLLLIADLQIATVQNILNWYNSAR
jgi:hypothetical protein